MTTINIDITSIASSTHPDDRVVFYAPEVRARIGGGLVSTAPLEVPLTNGVAILTNFEPGPVLVRFECLGIADTSEKLGIVPDSGEVDLDDVLALKFTWTPPVVDASLRLIIDQMNTSLATVATAVASEVAVPASQAANSAATASQYADDAAQSAADAEQAATTAAQDAAQEAALGVMGIFITETPPGSGLYEIGGEVVVAESPANSGLYTIGVI